LARVDGDLLHPGQPGWVSPQYVSPWRARPILTRTGTHFARKRYGRSPPHQPAPQRKQRDVVALRKISPNALRGEQHGDDCERAEENQVPGAEVGKVTLQRIEND